VNVSCRCCAQDKIRQMETVNGAVTLWDLDWPEDRVITTTPEKRASLLGMLDRDLAWLQSVNVMDYSIMIGVEAAKQSEAEIRAELSTIKPRGLRARAAEMGIEEETIEAAMDEDDVKEALIAMIMQGQGR
jgi:hypothetical protein